MQLSFPATFERRRGLQLELPKYVFSTARVTEAHAGKPRHAGLQEDVLDFAR